MNNTQYPNNIYVLEYSGTNQFNGKSHFVIVVAAIDSDIAKKYVKEKIGIDVEPTWLMNGQYRPIFSSDGSERLPIQAKILYNGSFHSDFNLH